VNVVRIGILSEDLTKETRKLLRLLSGVIAMQQDNKYAMIFDVAPNFGVPASEVFRENGFNAVAVEI